MSTWNDYDAPNVGLLFYKQIYKEEPVKQKIKLKDNELIIDVPKEEKQSPFDSYYKDLYQIRIKKYRQIQNPEAKQTFTLFTTYPGLLVGSGYPHDTKAKGDFKVGFYFDHSSGQPLIPGSSVKGVLNSVFELDVTDKGKNYTGEKSVEFVKWLIKECKEDDVANSLDVKTLRQMQREIFGDEDQPGKDVFFDAVIDIEKTGDKPFLANDFITPHENPLKNPNPIQFLKVLPGIGFEFRFKFSNQITWKPELKIKLFNKILLTLGLGTKTNVGFGQFEPLIAPTSLSGNGFIEFSDFDTQGWEDEETLTENRFNTPASPEPIHKIVEDPNWPEIQTIKVGSHIEGTVKVSASGSMTIHLHVKGATDLIKINGKAPVSSVLKLKVSETSGKHEKRNFKIIKAQIVP